MSDDDTNDAPIYCEQVSQRQADYESKIATQKGLIELGQKMAESVGRETCEEKHRYLLAAYTDIKGFNSVRFMTDYEKYKDKNERNTSVYTIVNYVGLLKELHECEAFIRRRNECKIQELSDDLETAEEQAESYITQLDEADTARSVLCGENEINKKKLLAVGQTNKALLETIKKLNASIFESNQRNSAMRYFSLYKVATMLFISHLIYMNGGL